MKINGGVWLNPQEQLQKNTIDIKKLQEKIKDMFNTTDSTLTSSSVSVATSSTNVGTATEGFLIDPNGLLFKITGNDEDNVLLQYYSDLKGPQGRDGAAVNIDDTGTAVDKCWSSNKTNSQINTEVAKAKDKGVYFTTTQPTENSGLYYLDEGYFDNVNSDIPIKAFDLLIYIDSDDKASEIYKVLSKTGNNWSLDKVGDIGGGKQLYQHNITIVETNGTPSYVAFKIINDSNVALTYADIRKYLYDNGFTSQNNLYEASGTASSNNYALRGLYSNTTDILVAYNNGANTFITTTPNILNDTIIPL